MRSPGQVCELTQSRNAVHRRERPMTPPKLLAGIRNATARAPACSGLTQVYAVCGGGTVFAQVVARACHVIMEVSKVYMNEVQHARSGIVARGSARGRIRS